MKKIIITFVASFLLCACSSSSLSLKDAKKIVLKDVGLIEENVEFSREETLNDEHIFEFKDENKFYSYRIDKEGHIISRQSKQLNQKEKSYITKEKAEEIALNAYQLKKEDVHDLKIEDDEENGNAIYLVKFSKENDEYKVIINKESGAIINKYIDKDDKKVV